MRFAFILDPQKTKGFIMIFLFCIQIIEFKWKVKSTTKFNAKATSRRHNQSKSYRRPNFHIRRGTIFSQKCTFTLKIRMWTIFLTFMPCVHFQIIPRLSMASKKAIAMKVMAVHNGQEAMLGISDMAGMVCKDGRKKKDITSTSQQQQKDGLDIVVERALREIVDLIGIEKSMSIGGILRLSTTTFMSGEIEDIWECWSWDLGVFKLRPWVVEHSRWSEQLLVKLPTVRTRQSGYVNLVDVIFVKIRANCIRALAILECRKVKFCGQLVFHIHTVHMA